ncbi:acyl-ACP--UDP-N-acetylglucosamine O-acyltransferase [Natronospira bacteriovora]|uniref:Acyl-[acyl-carrier-protein]--UDP-N-acetylglucosamine O-acyltransferase n=1 Tax=Natronospira bacteriovora TaxID=3069753 RepID=A0ABU0W340_9GAMM|nr:acyl-ACP--UDP-N-acetylglucosamine O-acyltransferase [Natronospira sp. AB-CW4]MDQ2068333.1 acyl-ACP--UDP-N-acetylglucosamine O-acyltransferase [Natronospira sp. AB-CW4]
MIDQRAVVDPEADIADDVEIGPFSIIGPGVTIGAGTVVGPHVVINGPTTIGRNNRFYQFCSIGEAPQDKGFNGEATRLEIGDGNTFREYCTVNRGTVKDDWVTSIGDDNWIMAYVHIAHDCKVGSHTIMANAVTLAGHVHIGDYAVMGGFSKVHQFCRVGDHAFCAMDSGVTRDVPPFVTVSGMPADPHGLNAVGLRRRGFTRQQLQSIRHAYRVLYRSGLRLEEALKELEDEAQASAEVAAMVAFIRDTSRSIVR